MSKQPLPSTSFEFKNKIVCDNLTNKNLKQEVKIDELTQLLISNECKNISLNNEQEDLMFLYPLTNKKKITSINENNLSTSSKILRLNIGGTHFMILIDAILRADQTSFLAKFVHLSHSARVKVN